MSNDSEEVKKDETPLEPLWSPIKVAMYLEVTPQTVYTWIRERRIEFVKLPNGRTVRIPESEVRRFVSNRKGEIIKDNIFNNK